MRVITGSARGRKLRTPKDMAIRPTADVVKEAVFNILQGDIEGRRVLDLFAGTGQLGIEALSRGAAECVFTDGSAEAVKLIRRNLELCGFTARVERTDAIAFLERAGRFDLVFIDPPYDTELISDALKVIQNVDILTQGGIIVCESRREKAIPPMTAPYAPALERCYGKTKITVFKRGSAL